MGSYPEESKIDGLSWGCYFPENFYNTIFKYSHWASRVVRSTMKIYLEVTS